MVLIDRNEQNVVIPYRHIPVALPAADAIWIKAHDPDGVRAEWNEAEEP